MRNCGVIAFLIFLITSGLAGVGVSRFAPPQPNFTFTADTTVIPAGGCVVLSWNVPRAVQLTMKGSNWPEGSSMEAENIGTTTACPSAAGRYVPDEPVIYTLTAIYGDGSSETRTITITYEGVAPTPPFPNVTPFPTSTAFSPTLVPTPEGFNPTLVPTPMPLAALYQPFEHGFMLHRAGENCVFAFSTLETPGFPNGNIVLDPGMQGQMGGQYAYCIRIENLPPLISATPEIFGTDETIGRVWHAYPEVQAALGQPLGAAYLYMGTIPAPPPAVGGAPYYTPIATLPDGRMLSCGTRGATSGTCIIE
jgi:hypothetical protein